MNRREFLGRTGLIGLGALSAPALRSNPVRGASEGGVRFAVLNDLHHDAETCDPWFRKVAAAVEAESPDFCVLAGDIANRGLESSLKAIRGIFGEREFSLYTVPGNHDCDVTGDTSLYTAVFPEALNYHFTRGAWQFIGLDTTQGPDWQNTKISAGTLDWVREAVSGLDPDRPTGIFSHFPLSEPIHMTPLNVDRLWSLLRPLNVRAAFCGHYHGQHAVIRPPVVTTNVCCSLVGDNFDGDPRKGFWMVEAGGDGILSHRLVRL